ncbi:hypothetical protein H9P43_005718 [Blastocladiella emersonii ATCC 22665]|nr:hypothetical protein H9P43_005718 [Blastocladiella emersonii ATCC 22665]
MGAIEIPGLPLWATVLLSAAFAATVCILVAFAIERFGGVVGGLLGSMPTNIIPPATGIWLQFNMAGSGRDGGPAYLTAAGVQEYQRAMVSVVFGMLLNHLPGLLQSRFPSLSLRQLLAAVVAIAISAWLAAAVALVAILNAVNPRPVLDKSGGPWTPDLPAIPSSLASSYTAALLVTGFMLAVGGWAGWTSPPAPRGKSRVPLTTMLFRGALAATAVATAVLLGQVSSYAAGIAAPFPAIFMSTLVGVWLTSGAAVSGGAIAPLLLGASSNALFALVSAAVVGRVPFAGVAAASFACGLVGVSAPSFFFLRWRAGKAAEETAAATAKLVSDEAAESGDQV